MLLAASSHPTVNTTDSSSPSSSAIATKTRICSGPCNTSIPQARLRAMPSARFCVPCQELLGDVPILRRYDDVGAHGEVHQTYFTDDHAIEKEMRRRKLATKDSIQLTHPYQARDESTPSTENLSIKVNNLPTAVKLREGEIAREWAEHAASSQPKT